MDDFDLAPTQAATLLDQSPSRRVFLESVLKGLDSDRRTLPCKYLYDERGSKLFDAICELEEYYPTRTELAIMERCVSEMAEQIGSGVRLVEFGSGSSVKTRILLDHLENAAAYVPVDISLEHLRRTADDLNGLYPDLEVLPVCADFLEDFDLPEPSGKVTHTAVYFPGSTIGNLKPPTARQLLGRIATLCGRGGGLLIGIDLRKETEVLEAAYNDSEGVTAEFNLNLLRRINRELDGDFEIDDFSHHAFYNPEDGRIEIHLVSDCDQTATVGGETFEFSKGEKICTEYSYKYTIEGFAELAASAGLALHRTWTDEKEYFAILHLAVED